MSPQLKRSLPVFLVLGAAVVGVYVIGPERLTGDASRIHEETDVLGPNDDRLFVALDKISATPTLPMTSGPELEQLGLLADEVASNPSALATLVTYFRDNGCVQPGSPSLVQLIGNIAPQKKLDPAQRQRIVDVLVDAASHEAPTLQASLRDGPAFGSAPQLQGWVASIQNGETVALPPNQSRLEAAAAQAQCVHLAVAVAISLADDLPDAKGVHETVAKTLATLPAGHPSTDAFVELAIQSAKTLPDARSTLEIAALPNLGTSARTTACRAAAAKGASAEELRARLGMDNAALQPCLVDIGDAKALQDALTSKDRTLRAHAIAKGQPDVRLEAVPDMLGKIFDPESPMGPRETRAWLSVYARSIAASGDPESMLVPLDGVLKLHPNRNDVPRLLAALLVKGNFAGVEFEEGDGELKPASAALAPLARGVVEGIRLPAAYRPARPRVQAKSAARSDGLEVALGVGEPGVANPEQIHGADPAAQRVQDHGAGLVLSGGLRDQCDVIAGPDDLRDRIAALREGKQENVVVCARKGRYPGNIVLDLPGIVVRSLEPRAAVFEGAVVVEQRATLLDLVFEQPVAMSALARGSQLAGNRIDNGVASLTTDLIAVGNQQKAGFTFQTPIGPVDARNYLPPSHRFVPERFAAMARDLKANRDKVDQADGAR